MKLLSQYRFVVMSPVDEHSNTTSLKSSSHSNFESDMLQSAAANSSNNSEVINCSDDTTVKALNKGPPEDSGRCPDKSVNTKSADTSPDMAILPVSSSDDIVVAHPVEATTTVNHEIVNSAATGNEGNNDVVLTFPQRVRTIQL